MYTIWSNVDIDYDAWANELRAECPEDYEDYDDDDMFEEIEEMNADYLDDERANLNVCVGDEIVVIGDLGFWDGRATGYKIIKSGNIADCLYDNDCDYCTWYIDALGDFRFDGAHHDGQNHYLYRTWKDGISDTQKENFLEKIYDGRVNRRDITRYTRRLGDDIAKVYGFKL